MLDPMHHFTSGFKSLYTNLTYVGIDELRQSCGGAGFLLSSQISQLWLDDAPSVTYEGVNVMLNTQASRYLLKQVKMAS
jgi:acyl-CoA oxidase